MVATFLISRPLLLPILIILLFSPSLPSFCSTNVKQKHRIVKRYVLHRHQWDHCQLTWSFRDPFLLFPNEERFNQAKKVIREAIDKWEMAAHSSSFRLFDVSPVSRDSPLNSRRLADIDIFFAEFGHGDSESFDGTGGLVAHSAYPPLGIVHFDASERWRIGQRMPTTAARKGNDDHVTADNRADRRRHRRREKMAEQTPLTQSLDLQYVALHEIGHALGLRHSAYRQSVMNTYYNNNNRQNLTVLDGEQMADDKNEWFKLSKDDEAAIGELFGEKCHRRKRKRRQTK